MYLNASTPLSKPLASDCTITFSPAYTYLAPTGMPSGKRIYLYYGLNSGGIASQWSSSPYSDLVANLRSAGDSVVFASESEPQVQLCKFANGGEQYRTQFNDAINTLMNTVESIYGNANKNIIGGISYGGLHALMGVVINGRFSAWFVHVPVTRLDALTEFAGVGDVRWFNPQYEIKALSAKAGFITWGTLDTRVNGNLTADIANQLPNAVTKISYVQDHSTNMQNVTDMTNWLANQ